jgi:hypothetical protein
MLAATATYLHESANWVEIRDFLITMRFPNSNVWIGSPIRTTPTSASRANKVGLARRGICMSLIENGRWGEVIAALSDGMNPAYKSRLEMGLGFSTGTSRAVASLDKRRRFASRSIFPCGQGSCG